MVTRLISSLLFISLHPSLAYAQSPAIQNSVVVTVIDEGVYLEHPALKNNLWTNLKEIPGNNIDDDQNGFVDDVGAWNFLDNNNNLTPKGGHGTKLAGLIAPDAKIMPLIVCSHAAGCSQQAIINAMYYAVDNGANVINLSLGDTAGYKSAYNEAIKYAYKHNVVIVASSGSAEVGHSLALEPMSPICNDNGENMVLGVGTIDESGNRPAWANFGACIDVSAKGTNVYTTFNPNFSNGAFYGFAEGNSFSTAKISAKAANLIKQNPDITVKEVIQIISGKKPPVILTTKPIAQVKGTEIKIASVLKPKLIIR